MTSPRFPAFHLGDRLRKAREDAGYYSASDFADVLGISRDSLRSYERNKRRPRRPVLVAWAEATGFTYDELVGGSDDGGGVAIDLRAPSNQGLKREGCIADARVVALETVLKRVA